MKHTEDILRIATKVREREIHDVDEARDYCLPASRILTAELIKAGYRAVVVQGSFEIDNPNPEKYAEWELGDFDSTGDMEDAMHRPLHYWVEVDSGREKIIVDITADQFNDELNDGNMPSIFVGTYNEERRYIKKNGRNVNPPKLLTLYHVTLEKNVPSIRKSGIRAQKKALWVGQFGQRLAPKDSIFAFDNFDDAGRWAFKTQYDMKKPVVILEFQDDGPLWQPDPHWQSGLSKGRWLTRREWAQGYPAVVRPSQIHGIITLDQPMIKALIKTLGEPKQVTKFGKVVKWSKA